MRIALVGMAGRFPGSPDVRSFWESSLAGRDLVRRLSREEALANGARRADVDDPAWVGAEPCLDGYDQFDARFFATSPREAMWMSPEQRLLLELAWEALEDAGIVPDRFPGRIGIFAGGGPSVAAYATGLGRADEIHLREATLEHIGNDKDYLATRVAHRLNLRGPAVTVQSACSTSLVAAHLALTSIRRGECDVALAGAAVVRVPHGVGYVPRDGAVESPDGVCRPLDANAGGTLFGSGGGLVLFAREDVLASVGVRARAWVLGSACNNDGGDKVSYMASSARGVAEVVSSALADAQVDARSIGFLELHGTATKMGDPVEVQALTKAYRAHTQDTGFCFLGAAKANVGHLDAAAGVVSLVKTVRVLETGRVPPIAHLETPNPRIPWDRSPFVAPTTERAWLDDSGAPRRAAVTALGIGGTNVHFILEEARAPAEQPATELAREPVTLPLVVSGHTPEALRANALRLAQHLEAESPERALDLAYSLATARAAFPHRLALPISPSPETTVLARTLRAFADAGALPREAHVTPDGHRPGRTVFLFSGQGSQRAGMGLALAESDATFARLYDEALAACDRHLERPLKDVLRNEPGLLDATRYTQPALFALEVALARRWMSLGVRPDVLLGHSVGELAAAHVAGVFSLDDAARLVCARGALMHRLATAGGAMVSLQADEASVSEVLSGLAEPERAQVDVAGLNAPGQTVVSGESDIVARIAAAFEARGLRSTRLTVSHAFHSPHMDGMLEAFRDVATSIKYVPPTIPVISNVTGKLADPAQGDLVTADYWVRHVRGAVRFSAGASVAGSLGATTTFLECGPHGVLCALVAASLGPGAGRAAMLPSMRKDRDESATFAEALGAMHVRGHAIDWAAAFDGLGARRVALPTYAFQRQRHWLEARKPAIADVGDAGLGAPSHPLFGATVALADGGLLLTGRLSTAKHPWLAHHVVHGTVLLPGTGFVELGLHAAEQVGGGTLGELVLEAPLALPPDGALRLQLHVGPAGADGSRELTFHTQLADAESDAPWTRHATGRIVPRADAETPRPAAWPPLGASPLDLTDVYARLAAQGLAYGAVFRGLTGAWRDATGTLHAEASLPADVKAGGAGHPLHPALFDSVLHALALFAGDADTTLLPFEFDGVTLHAPGATALRARIEVKHSESDQVEASLELWDGAGGHVASVASFRARRATALQLQSALRGRVGNQDLYVLEATPLALPESPSSTRIFARVESAIGSARPGAHLVVDLRDAPAMDPVQVHARTKRILGFLQHVVAMDHATRPARLTLLTSGATAGSPDDMVSDLAGAAAWGLTRTARSEHPEAMMQLVDVDALKASEDVLERALASTEPELLVRDGRLLRLGLSRRRPSDVLALPAHGEASTLGRPATHRIEDLALEPAPEHAAPLRPGEVRMRVHAAGLNFRDVLNVLGMYPGEAGPLGLEGAGIVIEVAPDVTRFAPGDRVMGLLGAGFGPIVVADARVLAPVPRGLSLPEAATIPLTFLTALYALEDLGRVRPGERLLVHAAAGGVGMAAVQLARHLGAEVFATASPSKWPALRAMGLDDRHLASSRNLDFERAFLGETGGAGVDVVLDSLAREFVDASLRLLPRGGRFLEMGKTDVRDPSEIARQFAGVEYRAFDLVEAGPERIGAMLEQLRGLFERGVLSPLPFAAYDLRHARHAFRHMAQAKHTGKILLVPPRPLDPAHTVLITGASGALARHVARHLVQRHGARHLLLLSRKGEASDGAASFVAELRREGALSVVLRSCDVADRSALESALATIPAERPLGAVLHLAGELHDATLARVNEADLDAVLRPKLDAAWALHALTRSLDSVTHFVLFSSISGLLGSAGQASYAAANTCLDALAQHRRQLGLPATSLAWGPWDGGGMAARLASEQKARLHRNGLAPIATPHGLALLDAALDAPESTLAPVRFDPAALRDHCQAYPLLTALHRGGTRRTSTAPEPTTKGLAAQLAPLDGPGRLRRAVELVRTEIASVLGMPGSDAVPTEEPLQSFGLDSLMAVDLRNRLAARIEKSLPATLLFDYPTATKVAGFVLAQLQLPAELEKAPADEGDIDWRSLQAMPRATLEAAGLLDALRKLSHGNAASTPAPFAVPDEELPDDEFLQQAKAFLEAR